MKSRNIKIGTNYYTVFSDDSYLGTEVFEPEITRIWTSLIDKNDIVVDVGANVGCTALLFGALAKKVHAFEPSPTTFALLEKNVRNAGAKNIFLYNAALGREDKQGIITICPQNRSGATITNMKTPKDHITEDIMIHDMDNMLKNIGEPKIDFIKIDTEGYEMEVIRGARKTIAKNSPIVFLELNHWCLNIFQRTSLPDFFDFLRVIFPILYAVDVTGCLDLHDNDQSYAAMYHHVISSKYPNIIAAFDKGQLDKFLKR